MTYAISDIHGSYSQFKKLLDLIDFSDRDTLYILGDSIDREPEGLAVLQDVMERPNVIHLLGNHECLAYMCLKKLTREITEDSIDSLSADDISSYLDWCQDGGQVTADAFRKLSRAVQEDILDYISEMDAYEEITVGRKNYMLVHASITPGVAIEEQDLWELIENRPEIDKPLIPGTIVVVGHTPTRYWTGKDEIIKRDGVIAIDCAASFGGRLAAIRLDDLQEFYIDCN